MSRLLMLSLGNSAPGDGGLFEFCSQLGQRLANLAPQWAEQHGLQMEFHLKEELHGRFGPQVQYRVVSREQRRRHTGDVACALWHSLHQLNPYLPPALCGPRLVTVHDLNYLYGRNAFSRWRHGRRMQALLARSDALACISHHTAGDVRRHLHWAGELPVIHNGARDLHGHPQEPLPGLEMGQPFLLHVSRLSPAKNLPALLALAQAMPETPFAICSPPNEHARALAARARGLPNLRLFQGITEAQKAWAYAHCKGFIFPSLTEGFGLPPIEAMHFGKPVFLSRRTSLPEVGGTAAFFFDDFEGAAMRRVVETGLRQAEAEPGFAARVRGHAAQFNWDACAAGYVALYARLLKLPALAAPAMPAQTRPPAPPC